MTSAMRLGIHSQLGYGLTGFYGHTVKQDWRGLLILRDRSQGLGWEVPYTELLERRVTQLYLSDLRDQQELTPNLMLLQFLVTEKDKSAVIGRKLLQEADTTGEFQRRLSLIETILANKFPELTKEIIMNMLDLEIVDITQSRFYQEIIEQGLQEGEANLVIRQLRRRLGGITREPMFTNQEFFCITVGGFRRSVVGFSGY